MKTPGARQFALYLLDEQRRRTLGPFASPKGRRYRQKAKPVKPTGQPKPVPKPR